MFLLCTLLQYFYILKNSDQSEGGDCKSNALEQHRLLYSLRKICLAKRRH